MGAPAARPRVSVCIPVFNGEPFIGAAIESVLSQDFSDFELLVLDNASTDGTVERVRRFRDPRVQLHLGASNIGAIGNWNRALSVARGSYLKILCADDWLFPHALARQVEVLDRPDCSGVALVCSARQVVDDQGRPLLRRGFGRAGRVPGRSAVRTCVRAGTNRIGEPAAVLFRSSLLERTGGFDPLGGYAVDVDLWSRLLLRGDLFVLPEPLCAFRVSPGSWSVQIARRQSRDVRAWMKRLAERHDVGLTRSDIAVGRARAAVNQALRSLLYSTLRARDRVIGPARSS